MSDENKDSKKKRKWIVPIIALGGAIAAGGLLYHTGIIAGKKTEQPIINENYFTHVDQYNYFIKDSIVVQDDLNVIVTRDLPRNTPKPERDDRRVEEDRTLEDRTVYDGNPIALGLDVVLSGEYRGPESAIVVTIDPSILAEGYTIKQLGRKENGEIIYGTPYTREGLTGSNYIFRGIIPKVDENPTLSLTAILEREEMVRGSKVKKTYTDDQDLTVTAPRYFSVHDITGAYQVRTEHRDVHRIKIIGTSFDERPYERGGRAGLISNPSDGPVFSREYLKPGTDVFIEAYFLNDNGTLSLLDKRRF